MAMMMIDDEAVRACWPIIHILCLRGSTGCAQCVSAIP
jgi:hypothetical protein